MKKKHVEHEKKISDLKIKLPKYQRKDMIFYQVECILQVKMVIKFFFIFTPILSSLVLGSNKKVTKWESTGISPAKMRTFDINLETTISTLADGKVI